MDAACGRSKGQSLLVFAAASTADALGELGTAYETKRSIKVRFSWGASGDLARQVQAGAPVDVFLSADAPKMDALVASGHVAKSARRDLLGNRIVVVVPATSNAVVTSAADLAKLGRIAVADPKTSPAGAYAREWLERQNAWSALAKEIIPALDARAALAAAESGGVAAAIVYQTDARRSRKVRVAFEPLDQPKIVYPVASLVRAGEEAHRFVDWLATVDAKAVFVRHGFTPLA